MSSWSYRICFCIWVSCWLFYIYLFLLYLIQIQKKIIFTFKMTLFTLFTIFKLANYCLYCLGGFPKLILFHIFSFLVWFFDFFSLFLFFSFMLFCVVKIPFCLRMIISINQNFNLSEENPYGGDKGYLISPWICVWC